jgi:hypothetical protein
MKTVKTYMVRKPSDIEEVISTMAANRHKFEIAEIAETIKLTPAQYQEICESPLNDYDFLSGKGGYNVHNDVEYRQVVELTCEGEQPLYADPSGSSYCRYLGVKIEN